MKNKFFQFFILGIIILFIAKGNQAILYAKESLELCYHLIIPTLFPFFICSGLLIYSGFCESLSKIFSPIMKPLFNVNPNGSAAFILGIISGYPLGAITVCNLYQGFYISKTEAERMLGFCNNSGPLFIMGAVGIGMYSGVKVGIILYSVHLLSAVLTGMILRFYKKDNFLAPPSRITTAKSSPVAGFGDVLENSVKSILSVCGAVVFFSVISRLLLDFINIREDYLAFVSGVLEFASGTLKISQLNTDLASKLILSAFIVGFAGISVHIQVLAVVSKHELSMKPYILGKLLHGTISAGLMWVVFKLSKLEQLKCPSLSGGFAFSGFYIAAAVVVILLAGMIIKKNIRYD